MTQKPIEERKLELEREKARAETWTARLTAIAVFLTALVSAGTFLYSNYQHRENIEAELERQSREITAEIAAQEKQAEIDFALAAVDIVMSTNNITETSTKVEIIRDLFSEWLPEGNIGTLRRNGYYSLEERGVAERAADQRAKNDLMLLLIEHPEQRQEIMSYWNLFFPGEDWLRDIPKGAIVNPR